MNGKITIDGDYKGHYEIIKHGGSPDPNALCSLTYRIDRNVEVLELLKIMQNSIQDAINAEFDALAKNRMTDDEIKRIEAINKQSWRENLNRSLEDAGFDHLPDKALDCIIEEIEFQKAGEITEE